MYSADFRNLAIRFYDEGQSFRSIAAHLRISSSTVHRWVKDHETRDNADDPISERERNNRTVTPRTATLFETLSPVVLQMVTANPVTTLEQIRARLRSLGHDLTRRRVSQLIKHLRFSRKRTSKCMSSKKPANELNALVHQYCNKVAPRLRDRHKNLVACVDECYFSERVLPLYGYSKVGTKCVVRGPTSGWKKRSLLLSVASDGRKHYRVYDGSVNGQRFGDFVRSLPYAPGTTVVLDNVSFHKNIEPFVEKGYDPVFIPPYSPEFNSPVENAFSSIKGAFRGMWPWGGANDAVDVDACITQAVERLSEDSVRSSFAHLLKFVLQSQTQMSNAQPPMGNVQCSP